MKSILTLIFLISIISVTYSADNDNYGKCPVNIVKKGLNKTLGASDTLVIGFFPTDEVVRISSDTTIYSDILIVNDGRLAIEDCNFRLAGDIMILHNGVMEVRNSRLTMLQEYTYEHDAVIINKGQFILDRVDFESSHQSWSIGLAENASFLMDSTEVKNGFITCGMYGNCNVNISNSKNAGEYLSLGEDTVRLINTDQFLLWLIIPTGGEVEIALPDGEDVNGWSFPADAAKATGIDYEYSIKNCTNVLWGCINQSGSKNVFTDSEFRTMGLMFNNNDSTHVANISNQSTHVDDIINISDRELELKNSSVRTWSLYPGKKSVVSVNNCILGEILCQDTSRTYVENSICDGSGGYIGARNNSQCFFVRSLASSQVITRESGFLICVESSFTGVETDADDQSVMALLNTSYKVAPQVHGSSIVLEMQMPPVEGDAGSIIPVEGTCRILKGDLPIELFNGYRLYYSTIEDIENWIPYGEDLYPEMVHDGILGYWDTEGLQAGMYFLKMEMDNNLGDDIILPSSAYLNIPSDVMEISGGYDEISVFPNPADDYLVVNGSKPGSVLSVEIYNNLGIQMDIGAGINGIYDISDLTPGIYMVMVTRGSGYRIVKKIVVK